MVKAAMSSKAQIAEYVFTGGGERGSRFTLYPGRLVHEGGESTETVPLAQVAALRIEFLREPQKLKWGIIFMVLALVLFSVAGPLEGLAARASAEVAERALRDGVSSGISAALGMSFRALELAAASLPLIGMALAAWSALLLFLFAMGRTALTLVLGGVEREYAVRGRDRGLTGFAEVLAERLAELSG